MSDFFHFRLAKLRKTTQKSLGKADYQAAKGVYLKLVSECGAIPPFTVIPAKHLRLAGILYLGCRSAYSRATLGMQGQALWGLRS